jgi:ABC-type sugar transport system substrate-binding protein
MQWIQDGEMEATVLYPPTQAADGIRLARLIAQGKGLSDLVQVEVPRRVELNAPVVTQETSTSTPTSASSPDRADNGGVALQVSHHRATAP